MRHIPNSCRQWSGSITEADNQLGNNRRLFKHTEPPLRLFIFLPGSLAFGEHLVGDIGQNAR